MIIDFHTHIFPDELAFRALDKMSSAINHIYAMQSDGTLGGLLANMDAWGIDVSVVQPVITSPSQFHTINTWAQSICSDRIVSFGAIYPHLDDLDACKRDIDFIVQLGLKGLKFHPEFQEFIVDDALMLRVYDYALSNGLILLFHAGADPGFTPPFRSNPKRFAHIMQAMPGGTIIAAHLGGHAQWDDVEQYLVGTEIYLDTSMGFEFYPHAQFLRIVQNHGAQKILFGADSPWSNAASEIAILESLALDLEAKTAILGGNAQRILRL